MGRSPTGCGKGASRGVRRCGGSSKPPARSTAPTRAGIVHRDVKPGNLLVADDGTIRVSDFGIARAADQDTLTAAGSVLGSVGYMSPEQARGEPSSAASDRYGLACVAFELLTGRRPFEREGQAAEAAAHARETPPSARQLEPSLPPTVDAVFARGLAKRPDERHPTSAAFVDDLRAALAPPVPSTAATVVAAPSRPGVAAVALRGEAARPRGAARRDRPAGGGRRARVGAERARRGRELDRGAHPDRAGEGQHRRRHRDRPRARRSSAR